MTDTPWKGYWPASITPFGKDGSLDVTAWRELLDLYRALGVHGVLVNGSSGEWFAQSPQERRQVAEIAVEQADGAFPVVVGCSQFTPAAVAELASHAETIGADGVLFTPPPYVNPTEAEILHFYQEVAEAVEIPIMVYNWPRGTVVDLSPGLLADLARIPNVVSIKDSTPDYAKHLSTLATLGGTVGFFADYISRLGVGVLTQLGGSGSIEGGALGAAHGVAFYECMWSGDLEGARGHADPYAAQLSDLVGYNFAGRFGSQIAQIKAAMRMLGQPGGYCRRPLDELDDGAQAALRAVLQRHGLL